MENPPPEDLSALQQWAAVMWRQARRVVILVIGVTIVLFGLALLVLPGPAFLVIPAGLAILAVEFAWAARWLRRIKKTAGDAWQSMRSGWTQDP